MVNYKTTPFLFGQLGGLSQTFAAVFVGSWMLYFFGRILGMPANRMFERRRRLNAEGSGVNSEYPLS